MPSTYTNDLRLELIAVGEGAGSAPNDWGSKTNVNLTSIAGALGAGIEQMASDADATITMADGAADEFRSLFLKITSAGSLTATRTLTFAPNTISKLWIIENATTGSQSITISQGTGANVTIASGATKVIYTDGAGSGAAVVDALVDLDLTGTTTIANATIAAGTFTGSQIDLLGQGDVRWQDSSGGQYAAIQAPTTIASSYTITLPANDGDADQFLQTNGSGVTSWAAAGGAYTGWSIKTSAFTASAGDQLIVNSASAVTITLPASPSVGDTVVVKARGGGTVTLARNSSNFESGTADGTLPSGNKTQVVYINSTIGWEEL